MEREGVRVLESATQAGGREWREGGVSDRREGAVPEHVCVELSVCDCVRGRRGKLGEVSHPSNER